MFKITIIQIGKTKSEYLDLENEFIKRCGNFCDIEIKILNEAKTEDKEKNKDIEGKEIVKILDKNTFTIALDEHGKNYNSLEFANFIKKEKDFGKGKITFIIGGAFGLSETILNTIDTKIALSKMTFTHQMVRIILTEQIYRAFTIIHGKTYHY